MNHVRLRAGSTSMTRDLDHWRESKEDVIVDLVVDLVVNPHPFWKKVRFLADWV